MAEYVLKNVRDFNLQQTLECGQCFHFYRIDDGEYLLSAFGRMLHIGQDKDTLIFYDTDEAEFHRIWRPYFDLDRDYAAIRRKLLSRDEKLADAINAMGGVRILNQDFFETLISFIISQNKQIQHIKKIVTDISAAYGTFLGEVCGISVYAFPTVQQMSDVSEQDLRVLKAGFRAPYIKNAIEMVSGRIIDENVLCGMDNVSCIHELCRIKGVGVKVANCVSLFSLGRRDSFPVDVWMKRIMERMYFEGKDTPKEVISAFAREKYGELSGYAQQYLFYYGRSVKMGADVSSKKGKAQ